MAVVGGGLTVVVDGGGEVAGTIKQLYACSELQIRCSLENNSKITFYFSINPSIANHDCS